MLSHGIFHLFYTIEFDSNSKINFVLLKIFGIVLMCLVKRDNVPMLMLFQVAEPGSMVQLKFYAILT